MAKILVVDDEKDIRDIITDILEDDGFEVVSVKSGEDATREINKNNFTAAILDIWLEGSAIDGIGVLEYIQNHTPETPVIMISGHGNISNGSISNDNKHDINRLEIAVQAIKKGAYDFIEKPFSGDKLLTTLKRAIEVFWLKRENTELKQRIGELNLIGNSTLINNIRTTINKVAQTSSRIMITGPSGSGKRLVAELIHYKSKRAKFPFVVFHPINSDIDNFQKELTNSLNKNNRNGIFAKANNGTLFIDEVTDLSIDMQNIILQVLQNPQFDIRIIASTARNIEKIVSDGKFSEGLYHRLNVIPIKIPSLFERKEDIIPLSEYFIQQLADKSGLPLRKLAEDAIATLQLFDWPGNVRQLRNVLEWVLIMASEDHNELITASMLPYDVISKRAAISRPDNNASLMSLPLREAREIFEAQYLAAQLQRFNGNISKTANFIGMERSALHRKLKALHIINDSQDNSEEFINVPKAKNLEEENNSAIPTYKVN